MKKKIFIPQIITLIGPVLTLLSTFLPYYTITEEHEALLKYLEDYSYIRNTSLFKYFLNCYEYKYLYFGSIIMLIAIVIFLVLTILFAISKKPIPAIIFDALTIVLFIRQSSICKAMSRIGEYYNWGVGYYLFYILAIITLLGAVWMLIAKKALKRKNPNSKTNSI